MTDWEKIKTEYLSGNTSYRKLAAKYGIPRTRIEERGRQEDWPWLRESLKHDSFPLLHDSLCEKNSRSAQKIMDVADKILDKISESLDALSTIDGNTLKHFTAALKELRDIKGIKSKPISANRKFAWKICALLPQNPEKPLPLKSFFMPAKTTGTNKMQNYVKPSFTARQTRNS
ncbi:MAG: hypothetical protein E7603_09555 [Ruminococcaceae bacterium]|nr:hypothetical protein [Oscillospiraceae bacterium]